MSILSDRGAPTLCDWVLVVTWAAVCVALVLWLPAPWSAIPVGAAVIPTVVIVASWLGNTPAEVRRPVSSRRRRPLQATVTVVRSAVPVHQLVTVPGVALEQVAAGVVRELRAETGGVRELTVQAHQVNRNLSDSLVELGRAA